MVTSNTTSTSTWTRQSIVATPASGFCTNYIIVRTLCHQIAWECSMLFSSMTTSIQRSCAQLKRNNEEVAWTVSISQFVVSWFRRQLLFSNGIKCSYLWWDVDISMPATSGTELDRALGDCSRHNILQLRLLWSYAFGALRWGRWDQFV